MRQLNSIAFLIMVWLSISHVPAQNYAEDTPDQYFEENYTYGPDSIRPFDKKQWKRIVSKLDYTLKDSAKAEKDRRRRLKDIADKKDKLDSLDVRNSLLDSLEKKDWQDVKEADNEAADSLSFFLNESGEAYFDEEWQEGFEDLKNLEEKKVIKPFTLPAFLGGFFKVLLYALAIALLAFLIYKVLEKNLFVKNRKTAKKISYDDRAVDEIENLDELEQLFNKAVRDNNFRLAVRIQYLMIIRELSQKKMIIWKKDKTNTEYIREMRKSQQSGNFREITGLFERIWYGHFDINKETFEKISPRFREFVNTIK